MLYEVDYYTIDYEDDGDSNIENVLNDTLGYKPISEMFCNSQFGKIFMISINTNHIMITKTKIAKIINISTVLRKGVT